MLFSRPLARKAQIKDVSGPQIAAKRPAAAPTTQVDVPRRATTTAAAVRDFIINHASLSGQADARSYGVLEIANADISGVLNLQGCSCTRPILFQDCEFASGINLNGASLSGVTWKGCNVPGIDADDCQSTASIYFYDGSIGRGAFLFRGARIEGSLHFTNADIEGATDLQLEPKLALDMSRATISGSVFLNGTFRAVGQVRLRGATIGSNLDCRGGAFVYPAREALVADGAEIGGDVHLSEGFSARGQVNFRGVEIGQRLFLVGALFDDTDPDGCMPEDEPLRVALDLRSAHIGQSLTLEQSSLSPARGATFIGGLSIVGARIDGDVSLSGAKIRGCHEATAGRDGKSRDHAAVQARRAQIGGGVFLDQGFSALGEVDFSDADIGGSVRCIGASFVSRYSQRRTALKFSDARIAHALVIRPPKRMHAHEYGEWLIDGDLDLRNLKVTTYVDDERAWPRKGDIGLDGFTYDVLNEAADGQRSSYEMRLRWLRRQRPVHLKKEFRSQPWQQLVSVFRAMGDVTGAKRIASKKEWALLWSGSLPRRERAWSLFSGLTVGHGFWPHRAFWISAFFVLFGWGVFEYAYNVGAIAPTDGFVQVVREKIIVLDREGADEIDQAEGPADWVPKDYLGFNSFWYSIDAYIPLLSLGPEAAWQPHKHKPGQQKQVTEPYDLARSLSPPEEWPFIGDVLSVLTQLPLLGDVMNLLGDVAKSIVNCFGVWIAHPIVAGGWLPSFYYMYVLMGWVFLSLMIAGFSGILRND